MKDPACGACSKPILSTDYRTITQGVVYHSACWTPGTTVQPPGVKWHP